VSPSFATRTEATRDDWQTPAHIVQALGEFDLDPCANVANLKGLATAGYPVGGLVLPWHGRIWCNPPYGGDCRIWMRRLADHGDGIALIPPRVGSHWFQAEVLDRCDAVLFLRGRVSFLDNRLSPVSGNNADSVLIAFGALNALMLQMCNLPGKFWRLK
jgi:hypothetical protein